MDFDSMVDAEIVTTVKELIPRSTLHTLVEAKRNVSLAVQTVTPIIQPLYQKVVRRVKEWASQISESELDHFILGMVIALVAVFATIFACQMNRLRRRALARESTNGSYEEIHYVKSS
jgi:hypothetical protein